MEWVETTGRTVEAALDAALDELGVDQDEAEYEVLEEPRGGLRRRDARIRARVKPVSREKPERERQRRGQRRDSGSGKPRAPRREPRAPAAARSTAGDSADSGAGSAPRRRRRGGRGRGGASRPDANGGQAGERVVTREDGVNETEVSIEEQVATADEFTRGLVDAFDVGATVTTRVEDEAILVDVTGPEVGLLVGPKGATLQSIEELVRTVVQRRTEGHGARIFVDVGGYRAKRRAALEEFALDLAEKVRSSGKEQALEPMSASDRKVVHDAIAGVDGVGTLSEGEDPRRRVVVRPS
jgi:spoIIIJ-associated protein